MQDPAKFRSYHEWVCEELENCIKFWLNYGPDRKNGGVYTCLDRQGTVYSTDKSVWIQGGCAWVCAFLCTVYGAREEWLSLSRSCLNFLDRYCVNRGAGGRMYFTVTAEGKPLRQGGSCTSESFCAMANAEFYHNTGEEIFLGRARRAYNLTYRLNNRLIADPAGPGPKVSPKTRPMRSLTDSMNFLNLTAVMRRCDPDRKAWYDAKARECTAAILRYHYRPELSCTLERVGLCGQTELSCTEGRSVSAGHGCECSWFLMEEAKYEKNRKLYEAALKMFRFAMRGGWDEHYGGLLYFGDCLGKPPEMCQHDMKLWWPQSEALISSLMLYHDTKEEDYLNCFYRLADYCREHFTDPLYGEWVGYLRRDGVPTEPSLKGSICKGPYHLPRSLILLDCMMSELEADACRPVFGPVA